MRHERLLCLLVAVAMLAACTSVGDGGKRRRDTQPAALTDDGEIVAAYLQLLDRLGGAGPAEQAEILHTVRADYLANPSTQHRLRYALALAIPGHHASDPEGARALLGESLAVRETLLPSERALADLMVRELDARLALGREIESLRERNGNAERDQVAGLHLQLQQEIAEKERLRRELEQAQAKLEAIATLEGSGVERRP